MKNPSTRIDLRLNDERQKQVKKNCAYLKSVLNWLVMKASLFKDTKHALEEHLSSCPINATYMSKTSQNDLLECMSVYSITNYC